MRGRLSRALPAYSLKVGQLWRHSSVTSAAAEVVREHATAEIPAEVSTAAVLHDIGKCVLAEFVDQQRGATLRAARSAGATLVEAEFEALAVNHAEVGATICPAWGLPETIRLAVQCHHDPQRCDTYASHALFVADRLAHEISQHQQPRARPSVGAQRVASMKAVGLDPSLFAGLVMETMTRYRQRTNVHDRRSDTRPNTGP